MTKAVGLEEVLRLSFRQHTQNLYTALPCVVLSVDNAQQRVDVQPCISERYKDGTEDEHPPILGVPFSFPSTEKSVFSFPINVGTTGMCIFSQRSMDNFKSGDGAPTVPNDFRRFDKRDAVFYPGTFPFGSAPNNPSKHSWPHDPNDMVMVHNLGSGQEAEVRIKAGGNVEINTNQVVNVKAQTVNVEADTASLTCPTTTVTGDINMTGTLTVDGIVMNTHVHTGVTPGSGSTGLPV